MWREGLGLSAPALWGTAHPQASPVSYPGLLLIVTVVTDCGLEDFWVPLGPGWGWGPCGALCREEAGVAKPPPPCGAARLASWQVPAGLGQASFCSVPAPLASTGLATLLPTGWHLPSLVISPQQPIWGGDRALGSLRQEPQ